ncbi:MAG TPA: DJ-1/PfpI family protein [Chryseosolibacter sp.]|nr:DJ-1/PfpI family protein [Chryseosolibacter sp.]
MNKLFAFLFCVFLTINFAEQAYAQPEIEKSVNVAVFFYNGMELLDFAGPAEVFAAAEFNTYSVTTDGAAVQCNRTGNVLNSITPDHSMLNAPIPDIVVFPGGGTGRIAADTSVLNWVKDLSKNGTLMMSVCTGAAVLANTRMLDGMNITTWYGFIPSLQAQHPNLKVLENTRFVDNGIFLTTAGVSAGIDGALHLVSRIKGIDVAKGVAKYMEYDKWDPSKGRVDKHNPYIERLRSETWTPEKFVKLIPDGATLPYEGEFKNLAFEFLEVKKLNEAATVLEICSRVYPKSTTVYPELAKVYKQLGRSAPEDEEYYVRLVQNGKFEDAINKYKTDNKQFPGWIPLKHGGRLTSYGIKEYESGNYTKALDAFKLVAFSDPGFGSYYNVGEMYQHMGDTQRSVENYRKCLSYRPDDAEVLGILKKLEANQN